MYAGGRKQKISSQVAAGHMTTVVVDFKWSEPT